MAFPAWYLGNSVVVRRDSGVFPEFWTFSASILFSFSTSAPLLPQLDKGLFLSSGFNLISFLEITLFVSCLPLKYWFGFIWEESISSRLSGCCFMPSGFSAGMEVLWRSSEASLRAVWSCCSSRLFPEQFLLQRKLNPDLIKTKHYVSEFSLWGTSYMCDSSKQGLGTYWQ